MVRSASAVVVLCWFSVGACGTNLFTNGDFEGGTYIDPFIPQSTIPNGWGNTPPASVANTGLLNVISALPGFPDPAGGGSYVAFQSPTGADCLFQDLTTIAGQSYTISFWVAMTAARVSNTILVPTWDELTPNIAVLQGYYTSPTNTGPVPFQQFIFTVVASTNLTRVYFHGSNANGAILLDNVVVTAIPPIPEPASLWFIGSGLVVIGLQRGLRLMAKPKATETTGGLPVA